MGKIEDMQRQRAEILARAERRPKAPPPPASRVHGDEKDADAPAALGVPRAEANVSTRSEPADASTTTRASGANEAGGAPPTSASKSSSKSKSATAEEVGRCPECSKTKPVSNGVMVSHQKGFGKACPGSRKPPA